MFSLFRVHPNEAKRLQLGNLSPLVRVSAPTLRRWSGVPALLIILGCAALVLPTMIQVAEDSWSTEQGGHGPLVLVTGLWAVWRELKGTDFDKRPGNPAIWAPLMALMLGLFVVARVTGVLEIEGYSMYAALIIAAYSLFGAAPLRAIWFPLVYLAFTLPPPDTVVAFVTQPIKIAISSGAVSLLHVLGYPVASSGVTIQIDQYQLLVAAACAGLNSIVTLTALCIFYVYLRHRSDLKALLVIAVAAIPIAVISNFVRVLALILVTYYFGDSAAQGFVHDFAGLLMFSVALLTIFCVDQLAARLLRGRRKLAKQ